MMPTPTAAPPTRAGPRVIVDHATQRLDVAPAEERGRLECGQGPVDGGGHRDAAGGGSAPDRSGQPGQFPEDLGDGGPLGPEPDRHADGELRQRLHRAADRHGRRQHHGLVPGLRRPAEHDHGHHPLYADHRPLRTEGDDQGRDGQPDGVEHQGESGGPGTGGPGGQSLEPRAEGQAGGDGGRPEQQAEADQSGHRQGGDGTGQGDHQVGVDVERTRRRRPDRGADGPVGHGPHSSSAAQT